MVVTQNMSKIRIITAAIILGSLLIVGLSFLLPTPANSSDSYYVRQALLLFLVMINIGTAILFAQALKIFQTAFKVSYYLICTGLVIQAIGSAAYVVGLQYGLEQNSYTVLVGELLLAAGIVVIFSGLVRFAKLLQLRTWLVRPLYVGVVCLVSVLGLWFLPHLHRPGAPEFVFDLAHVCFLLEAVFYLFAAWLTQQIRAVASPVYSRSLLAFLVAVAALFPSALLLLANDYIDIAQYIPVDLLVVPYVLSAILPIVAGYMFNTVGILKPSVATENSALIDSIIFMASLASKPAEVDPILDELRYVTATLPRETNAEAAMSNDQKDQLRKVYFKLEDYLVTNERLRTFARHDLRELVQERYNLTF